MPVETLRPNAVGDVTQLSAYPNPPNWACVDEATSDGDTTYVYSPMVYAWYRDLYNFPSPQQIGAGDTINSLTIKINVRKTDAAGAAVARTQLKTGGTEYNGTTQALTTTYTVKSQVYTTNPKTGLPWTLDDIIAIQAGVGCRTDIELIASARCTQVWLEVDYTVAAPPAAGILAQII